MRPPRRPASANACLCPRRERPCASPSAAPAAQGVAAPPRSCPRRLYPRPALYVQCADRWEGRGLGRCSFSWCSFMPVAPGWCVDKTEAACRLARGWLGPLLPLLCQLTASRESTRVFDSEKRGILTLLHARAHGVGLAAARGLGARAPAGRAALSAGASVPGVAGAGAGLVIGLVASNTRRHVFQLGWCHGSTPTGVAVCWHWGTAGVHCAVRTSELWGRQTTAPATQYVG